MRWSSWQSGNVHQAVLVFAFVGSLLIASPFLYGTALNNLVWLAVGAQSVGMEPPELAAIEVLLAPPLTQVAKHNVRVDTGMGTLAALRGDEMSALAWWADGKHREQLMHFGQSAQAKGDPDQAILFYRGASDAAHDAGWYSIGGICQGYWAQLEKLSYANQDRCRHFFDDGNLLLNGGFDSGNQDGWQNVGDEAITMIDNGIDGPAVALRGDGESIRYEISQRLNLAPGTVVHFSAYVRSDDGGDAIGEISPEIRLLYIGFGKPDGTPAGNSLDMENAEIVPHQWTYVERTYTIPPAQGAMFRFAAAQVRGFAQIDVDQVKLEVLAQP